MFFAREAILFPADLADALEKAIRLLGGASGHGKALRSLWVKLAKGRGQIGQDEQHYSFKRDEAAAYAAYYLPANCLKAALVLEESFLAGTDPLANEANWLDLGTGPGTAFWGIAWWCARRGKKLRFTGWDQSGPFTEIARNLVAGNPMGGRPEFLAGSEDPLSLIRRIKPTHVSCVNSVAEIYPDPAHRLTEITKILQALRGLERADGKQRFLLLIEPGSRESSRELALLKDELQAHKAGAVIFPCMDARPCGALKNPQDWCHEEAACIFPGWLNELGAAAGMRKEAMLFSYAWIRAGEAKAPGDRASMRIVSQRMERKGQVECRLCTAEGKRMVRVQRSRSDEKTEFFFQSVRGDLWSEAKIGEKGDLQEVVALQANQPSSVFY